MRKTTTILGLVLILSLLAVEAQAVTMGPMYPPPGGVDWSGAGDPGFTGGATWTYENFDFAAGNIAALFWGPVDGSVGVTTRKYYTDPANWVETVALSTFDATTAVWEGQSAVAHNTYGYWRWDDVDTRYTITLAGAAQWIDPGTVSGGIAGHDGVVASVTGDYTATLLAEAYYPRYGWQPLQTGFNMIENYPGYSTRHTMSGGFWFRPIPEPTTLVTFPLILGGLVFWMRRRRRL